MKIIRNDIEIEAESDSFVLSDLMGEIKVSINCAYVEGRKFTIDIYNYMSRRHPEDHLGWWKFDIPKGRKELIFKVDFREKHIGSLMMNLDNRWYPASDAWCNPNYIFNPLQDFLFTVRKLDNELIFEIPFIMKINDYAVLKDFYHRLHKEHKYTDRGPFLWIMHEHKLRILKRVFNKFLLPEFRVLDVGCGRSLFTEIKREWSFDIYAGDIEHALILSRKKEFPKIKWLVMDASALPFGNGAFDAVFAGEIIEHMPNPISVLKEWRRVLRPKGILIITTPNKERFSNVMNKLNRPFSPDHFVEFSLQELKNDILPSAGFYPVKATGTYLELILRKGANGIREDYLQREGNKNANKWLMHLLNIPGRYLPRYCLDMIIVAMKKD